MRSTARWTLCLLLGAVMLFMLLPAAALAGTPTQYIDQDGNARSADAAPIDDTTATLSSGWYVVSGSVTRSATITVSGDVHLILADGSSLTVTGNGSGAAALNVSVGNRLTIYGQEDGTGTVTATGGLYAAGIGGGEYLDAGHITINGGTVTATGGLYAAGIGGGFFGWGGNIVINGGTVTATGGDGDGFVNGGAGIGGGGEYGGGDITINGGLVTATGGEVGGAENAAGIGDGGGGTGGTIAIAGGSVKATSISRTPTNKPYSAGGVDVYLTTITLRDAGGAPAGDAAVSLLGTNTDSAYGTRDMRTDTDGKLYVYLPADALTTAAQTTDGGSTPSYTTYRGSIQTLSSGSASGVLSQNGPPPEQSVIVGGSASFTALMLGLRPLTITGIGTIDTGIATASLTAGTVTVTGVSQGSTSVTVTYSNSSVETVPIAVYGPQTTGDFVVATANVSGYSYNPADGALSFTAPGAYTVSMRDGVTTTTSSKIQIDGGTSAEPVVIFFNNVSIQNAGCAFDLQNTSNVHLILMAGTTNTLTSGTDSPGIRCQSGATLTIDGSGALTANGGESSAGIGGGGFQNAGHITINGGTVTATGGASEASSGAGIGGGKFGSGGTITINGGMVTATGARLGAGIGGGFRGGGGTITINGGMVTATGGSYGPGIGVGGAGSGGTITINGGTVTATGGANTEGSGPGIGAGVHGRDGTIIIQGGTVTATGGLYAAGIGGGYRGSGGTITIRGGTVMATGGTGGAGIGGGKVMDSDGYPDEGFGGTVVITGGSVKAEAGGGDAEPIGHGDGATDSGSLKNSNGADVYLTTVTLHDVHEAKPILDIVTTAGYAYGLADVLTDADGKLYLYLPLSTTTSAARTGNDVYTGSIATTADASTSAGTLTLSGSRYDELSVATTSPYAYGIDGVLRILQPGEYVVSMAPGVEQAVTDRIVIDAPASTEANPVRLTLDNVKIVHGGNTGPCALYIEPGSAVSLTLEGQDNRLTSGRDHAGLGCAEGASLVIGGAGSLSATGGSYGAGIGGGRDENGGSITITGGTVTAYCDYGAAGVGGGFPYGGAGGGAGTITITGGRVTASGGNGLGAGIGGGGNAGGGGTVTISGGTVTATGGAAWGGDSGGAGIGGGEQGAGGTVVITGGSVNAKAGGGDAESIGHGSWETNSDSGSLKNSIGANVYLTTVTLMLGGTTAADVLVHSLTANVGYAYGTNDVYTDSLGRLYLYLPEFTRTTVAQAADAVQPAITRTYTGTVRTKSDHTATGALYARAQLATPTGLAWDTVTLGKATWSAVANVSSYTVQIYKGGVAEGSAVTGVTGTEYDFTSVVTLAGTGGYTFTVTAIGDAVTYTDSHPSAESAVYSYTAPATLYPVTVTVNKDGSLWSSDAPVITIGSDGASAIPNGSNLPNGTYNIYAGGTDTAVDVTVSDAAALATLDYYTLTLNAGTGITSVSGAGVYLHGAGADIDAVVAAGYTWDKWSDESTAKTRTVTITSTLTLTASATLTPPVLVSVTAPAAVTGVANGTEKTAVALGLPVKVTLVTDGGEVQADVAWDVAGCSYVPANIAEQTFTVAGAVSLPSGVINPNGVSLDVTISVTVNAASVAPTYTITASAGKGGAISPAGAVHVTEGGDRTFVITPDFGYRIDSVMVDGIDLGPKGIHIFTDIAADHTIRATFTRMGGGGGGGGVIPPLPPTTGGDTPTTPSTPTTPTYQAEVRRGGQIVTTLPVVVDSGAGAASVDAASQGFVDGMTVIAIPVIPDVDRYIVGLSVADLSTSDIGRTLTVDTDPGSIAIPSNMLTGISGIGGSKAEISIGKADKDTLPEGVKATIGDRPLISLALSIDGRKIDWSNPHAPVTVSIPYVPAAAELASPESIVIWYIDGSGRAVCVPNGHYDPATKTVVFTTTHFSSYAVGFRQVSFRDVAEDAWHAKAVSFIAAREITTGTGNGNFSPEAKLTRGQFIVMLMRAYGIAPDADPKDNFADAGKTYYTGYLAAAKRLGISTGVGNNLFAPGRQITRQEVFTLLFRALNVIGVGPQGDSSRSLPDFSDVGDIAPWAKDAMTLFVETGIISGSGGRLAPRETATRAQMAQVLYGLLSR